MDALGAYGSDDSDASSTNNGGGGGGSSRSGSSGVEAKGHDGSASRIWPWPCPPTIDGEGSWICGNRNHLIGEDGTVVASTSSSAAAVQQQHIASSSSTSTTTTISNANHIPLGQRLRAQKEFQNPKHLERTVERYNVAHPFGTTATTVIMELDPWEYNIVSLEEQARQQQQYESASAVPASDFVQDQISRAMVRHPPPSQME